MFLKALAALLFFLMLVAPFECYAIKITIIILLVIYRFFLIVKSGTIGISHSVFLWFLSLLFFGLFFSLWSLIHPFSNTASVLRVLPVYIVWPLVYLLLLPYLKNESIFNLLVKTMVLASFFISIYLIFAFFSLLGWMPISFDFFTLAKPILGRTESTEVQLFMPAVTSLLFLSPFLFTSLILGLHKKFKISRYVLLFGFLLTAIAILLTGRRSLLFNLLLSPVLIFFILNFGRVKLKVKEKKYILRFGMIICVIGVLLGVYLNSSDLVDLSVFWDFFLSGFDLRSNGSDDGSSIRGRQFSLLIKSWSDHPVLGSGLASQSQYIVRNTDAPWAYELSYMAWLFQTGIIGFTFYMSLLLWVFIKSIRIIKRSFEAVYLIPVLVGFGSFLIGCASNPYLQAYDHMWVLFLPVAIINYYELKVVNDQI